MEKRTIWDKLKSTKLWICLFSIVIIAWIVITQQSAFNGLAMALVVVPVSYFHENVKQKELFNKKENDYECKSK